MNEDTTQVSEQPEVSARRRPLTGKGLLGAAGYALVAASVSLVAWVVAKMTTSDRAFPEDGVSTLAWFLGTYAIECVLIFAALVIGFWGTRMLGAAGKEPPPTVIPDRDRGLLEPLITAGNVEGIHQYVILSSLSGFTGTFQKIGFSGLPLATVTLTLIFCGLFFIDKTNQDFLELAKLTTGAFIGSFVQKGQDAAANQSPQRSLGAEPPPAPGAVAAGAAPPAVPPAVPPANDQQQPPKPAAPAADEPPAAPVAG